MIEKAENVLFKMELDYGRCGKLYGVFIGTRQQLADLYGKTIYFGEVLGKHSEVEVEFESGDIYEVSSDQEHIEWLENVFASKTICGLNPLEYYDPDLEDEDEPEEI